MHNQHGLRETLCDLSQVRIAPNKNTWKRFSKYSIFGSIWSSLKREDCDFSKQGHMRSSSMTHYLQSSLRKRYVCMKTKDQLYQKESLIPRPRVVLKANSQCGSHDPLVQEARSSWESQNDAKSELKTRSNIVDYRVPGISLSTVKQQDASKRWSRCSKKIS